MTDVYAVTYGNYEPAEVDSLWTTKTEAQKRCDEANTQSDTGMWNVEKWQVQETFNPIVPA